MDQGRQIPKVPYFKSISFKYLSISAGSIASLLIFSIPIFNYAWQSFTEDQKTMTIAFGALAWFIELGAVTYLYRMWIFQTKTLARGVEIIHHSNPSHEIDVFTGDEYEQIGQSVGTIGHMAQEAMSRMEALVEAEVGDLTKARAGLSKVLNTIEAGVVVINIEGLVTLCNHPAEVILNVNGSMVGHSIFKHVNREEITGAMECLQSGENSTTLDIESEKSGDIHLAPYIEGGNFSGYILTIWPSDTHRKEVRLESVDVGSRPEYYDFDLMSQSIASNERLDDYDLEKAVIVTFDCETTGLQPSMGDKIISIGAVKIRNRKLRLSETFEALVYPEMSIPEFSIQFHNITDDMVQGQPTLEKIMPRFLDFCDGAILMGHNVAFDLKFMNIQREKNGQTPLAFPVLDTLLLSYVLHDHYDDHNLKSLAERLGVRVVGLHTALGDSIMTSEVFLRLLPLLKNRGINTVNDAITFSRKAFGLRREQRKF